MSGVSIRLVAVAIVLASAIGHTRAVLAQDDDPARAILRSMSDFMASQESFTVNFDTELEVITPEIQKLQFSSTGRASLTRPDRLRVERLGGYSHVELVFNGTLLTIVDHDVNQFAQIKAPGSIDGLIDRLRGELGIDVPGADILLSDIFAELDAGVIDAKHIGQGVVDGVECEHLAFRNADTDWQIWIQTGAQPVPRKYVITSKAIAGAPEYTLRMHNWIFGASSPEDGFEFTPAAGAQLVAFDALEAIDELPPSAE